MFAALPPVTRALLYLNIGVFVVQSMVGDAAILWFGLWSFGSASAYGALSGFQPWQIVTYGFLHGSLTHLAVNMLALYMFGGQLEAVFGPRRFLNLWLASVITAAISQLVYAALEGGAPYPTVGASGGVFGVLLAYAIVFPNRTIVLLIPPIPLPAWLFVTLYGLLELTLGFTGAQAGVAHFAHLGGMLGAWLLIQHWRGRFPFRRR